MTYDIIYVMHMFYTYIQHYLWYSLLSAVKQGYNQSAVDHCLVACHLICRRTLIMSDEIIDIYIHISNMVSLTLSYILYQST